MKFGLALLLLISTAHAEGFPPIELNEQLDTARVERASGVVLSMVGAALALSSIGMAAYAGQKSGGAPVDCGPDPTCQHEQPLFYAGIGMAVTGSMLLGIGIPLWAVGVDRVRALEKRARISGFVGKNGGGVAVRVSF